MSDKERLERIQQESITDAIEWGCQYGNRSQVKTDRIIDDVEWLIQQAEQTQTFKQLHKNYLDRYVDAVGEINRLREALAFYADAHKWSQQHIENDRWTVPGIMHDKGIVAAKALEGTE